MPHIKVMTGALDVDGQIEDDHWYHWLRIVGGNNRIMLDSEDYSSKSNAIRAAKILSKATGLEIK